MNILCERASEYVCAHAEKHANVLTGFARDERSSAPYAENSRAYHKHKHKDDSVDVMLAVLAFGLMSVHVCVSERAYLVDVFVGNVELSYHHHPIYACSPKLCVPYVCLSCTARLCQTPALIRESAWAVA